MANLCKNRAKITANTQHQIMGLNTVYKTQHLALPTIITCSARFSSVKFCRCGALKYIFYKDDPLTYWANEEHTHWLW